MDEDTLKRWQRLHLRTASGDTLSAEEQTFYEAGRRELDQSEDIGAGTIARIAQMKQKLTLMEAERTALTEERLRLEKEIARLEAALDDRTRRQLAAGV
jgi:hypothetical protein